MRRLLMPFLCLCGFFFLSDAFPGSRQADLQAPSPGNPVILDLYVMSRCPFTLEAEKELIPFVEEKPGKIDLRINYIAAKVGDDEEAAESENTPSSATVGVSRTGCSGEGIESYQGFSSLHGRAEVEENMRQLIVREFFPNMYLDYLLMRSHDIDGDWRNAAETLGIDTAAVIELVRDGTGAILLGENIRLAQNRMVSASPTLFIDGRRWDGRVDAETVRLALHGQRWDGNEPASSSPGIEFGREGQDRRLGTANPAQVYCRGLGYDYRIAAVPGGQVGVCVMPDGLGCEEWDFFKGTCGREYSYCARSGYDLVTLDDGNDPFSPEYAVCVSEDGGIVGSVTELTGLSARATKASAWTESPNDDRRNPLPPNLSAPPAVDWRDHDGYNWVTPVKNQGGCGSCWAFGAVAAVEAVVQINAGDPFMNLDLSEEYLVSDCHGGFFSQSCCGGMHSLALQFIRNQGIPDESCLPYIDGYGCTCGGGTCDYNCEHRDENACSDATCSDRCSDWEDRLTRIDTSGPATNIREAIANSGPVSVSFGIGSSFGGYWDGDIYRCTNDNGANHAIALVGYDDAGGYWIGKNSWGTGWGDGGFFKIGYGECSVESDVQFADIITCGDNIGNSLTLYDDLPDCEGDGLVITADDVTLNCNGASITGTGTGSGIVIEGRQNVLVRNCIVSGFETGIALSGGQGNLIKRNTMSDNLQYGIYLTGSIENSIWRNDFLDNPVNAWEEADAAGNSWFMDQNGNDWSDFEENEGYPNVYVVDGPGDGIDPWPNGRIHKMYREATGP